MKQKLLVAAIIVALSGCKGGSSGSGNDGIIPPKPEPEIPVPPPEPPPTPEPPPPEPPPTPEPPPPPPPPEPEDTTIGEVAMEGHLFPNVEARLLFKPNSDVINSSEIVLEKSWIIDSNRSGTFGDHIDGVDDKVVNNTSLILNNNEYGAPVQVNVRAINSTTGTVVGEVNKTFDQKRLIASASYSNQSASNTKAELISKHERKLYSEHISVGVMSNGEVFALSDDYFSDEFQRVEKIGNITLNKHNVEFFGNDNQKFISTGDKLFAIGGVFDNKQLTNVASATMDNPITDANFFSNGATKLLVIQLKDGEYKLFLANQNEALREINLTLFTSEEVKKVVILRAPSQIAKYPKDDEQTDRGSQIAVITTSGKMKIIDFYNDGISFKETPIVTDINTGATVIDAVTYNGGLFVLSDNGSLKITDDGGFKSSYKLTGNKTDIESIYANDNVFIAVDKSKDLYLLRKLQKVDLNGYEIKRSPFDLSIMGSLTSDLYNVEKVILQGEHDALVFTSDGDIHDLDFSGAIYDYTYNNIRDWGEDIGTYEGEYKNRYGAINEFSKGFLNSAHRWMQTPVAFNTVDEIMTPKNYTDPTTPWTDHFIQVSEAGLATFTQDVDPNSDELKTKSLKSISIGGIFGSDNLNNWAKTPVGSELFTKAACGTTTDAICDIQATKNAVFVTNGDGDLKMIPLAFNASGEGLGKLTRKMEIIPKEDYEYDYNRMISSPNHDDFSILGYDKNSKYLDPNIDTTANVSDRTIINVETYKGEIKTASQRYGFKDIALVDSTYNCKDSISDSLPMMLVKVVDPDGSGVELTTFNKPFSANVLIGGLYYNEEGGADYLYETKFGIREASTPMFSPYYGSGYKYAFYENGKINTSVSSEYPSGWGAMQKFFGLGNYMPNPSLPLKKQLGVVAYIGDGFFDNGGKWTSLVSTITDEVFRDQDTQIPKKLAYSKVWVGSPYQEDLFETDKSIISTMAYVDINNTPNADGIGSQSNTLVVAYGASGWNGTHAPEAKSYSFKMKNDVVTDLAQGGGVFTLVDQDAYLQNNVAFDGVRAIVSHETGTEIHYISRDGSTGITPTVKTIDDFIKNSINCDALSGRCNTIENISMDRIHLNPKRYSKAGEITDANREHLTMITMSQKDVSGDLNTIRACFNPNTGNETECYDRYKLTPEQQGMSFVSLSKFAYPRKLASFGEDAKVGKNVAEVSTLFKDSSGNLVVSGNFTDTYEGKKIGISDDEINAKLRGHTATAINYFSDGWLIRLSKSDSDGDYSEIIATNGTKLDSEPLEFDYDLSELTSK